MSIISRSTGRKIFATTVLSLGLVFVYETTIRDSRYAARQAMLSNTSGSPVPGTRLLFQATAYCKGTTTASGVNVRTGIAAADPQLLPVGSVISINVGDTKYTGIYTIMDTGPAVQGRTLDVYMWSCHEALAFGRKQVQVTVLRLGWNPQHSTPGIIDTLFRSRQVKKERNAAEAAQGEAEGGAREVPGAPAAADAPEPPPLEPPSVPPDTPGPPGTPTPGPSGMPGSQDASTDNPAVKPPAR
jgi:3D (Asp-Asp-Asp) domain-containing protein